SLALRLRYNFHHQIPPPGISRAAAPIQAWLAVSFPSSSRGQGGRDGTIAAHFGIIRAMIQRAFRVPPVSRGGSCIVVVLAMLLMWLAAPGVLQAQGTKADYERAA